MTTQTLSPNETVYEPAQSFMPVMRPHQALERYQAFKDFVADVLRPGVDYGIIPGTNKPTLLKPGAEKLATFFGLSVHFEAVQVIEDWSGEQHGGEPLFYYWYRCVLCRDGRHVADAEASCNSREKKYRWRDSQRKCPSCGQPAIIKGRPEYGGGWVCFAKKGGCGAKFRADDTGIAGQQTGREANEDIADAVNTIQKMAQKRALVAATLIGTNASEYFTQDVEDYIDADFTPAGPAERVEATAENLDHTARRGRRTSEPHRNAIVNEGDPKHASAADTTNRAPVTGTLPADPVRVVDAGETAASSWRPDRAKKSAEPRPASAYAAGASNGDPKHSAKEAEKLAPVFETAGEPVKPSMGTVLEGSAPSMEDAMAEWKAAWAQANKAGVRGSQYYASAADNISAVVEKTTQLKDAIRAKQGIAAGR